MPAENLSLYLDLEDGQKVDLEVASRAALAFAQMVRESAAFLDPFSVIQLQLVSTTEGSISFNTKIRLLGGSGKDSYITVGALIIVCLGWLGAEAMDFIFSKMGTSAWEQIFGADEAKLSDKDKNDIIERVSKAIKAEAGKEQAQKIYSELEKDEAVRGVGLSQNPGARPKNIVPRSEFRRRSGTVIVEEPEVKKKTKTETVNLVLVSPVLLAERKRRWRFRLGREEFGAPVKDEHFLDAVVSGKHPILMRGNIQMTVRLQTVSEFRDGLWHPVERTIWEVLSVPGQYRGQQQSLPLDEHPKTHREHKDGKQ